MTDPTQLNELFYQAGTLMLVGMAFVFAFLMLMIFVVQNIITPLGKKYDEKNLLSNTQAKPTDDVSPQMIAAISAAVKQYRSNK
ncbi:MAG: OadG family protein [Kangiellaceae bacterium]